MLNLLSTNKIPFHRAAPQPVGHQSVSLQRACSDVLEFAFVLAEVHKVSFGSFLQQG